ncbi:putative transcription factor interactor and regulator CCHC(Zn) family [Helianthus annuus]|uniref:Transcription factor interactor and regulator CCHC(Zn) family n=1 Tax=Helianthus annuus TaxID=4232 RepID=A0A9K3E226_HELAN|nr:putative transcription factor interactor and regulator CCHC(Zn) family [Helianthus annuus]KAJ0452152.1 putative transcription factor interactor and regulator CCHC(Zn) family [Helianthus annuus]KAJ0474058.1 putative transcription factor interactor and regulator ARID family [Helianthus annuus]KAJ0649622.1 putative transcription factor interactor and regulator CCHC(Zn) family [Helianthus annuus]KAJ0653413.1 putative transcription factor interactor and regulator CCHC(Zn) family [Helianthus annuu
MHIQFGSLVYDNMDSSYNPNLSSTSAATRSSDFQQSGIRATKGKMPMTDLKPTSSMLPCQHCADEMKNNNKRFQRVKTCFYCHQPGHQIYKCNKKETDEAIQLIRQAVNVGIQNQREDFSNHQEMIVVGTEGGLWSDIWYVSSVFKHHMAGNLNVFKRIKHIIGVDTQSGENNFLFTRGVGSVEIKTGNETMRIQSVFYSPELDRNVLSIDQLTMQGFTVNKNGDTCKIYPMFSTPVDNSMNEKSGLTREEEIGLHEKQNIIEENVHDNEFKERYLNSYFEDLDLSSQEPDWNMMIVKNMEFNEFDDCVAFINLLDDREFVIKYKHMLDSKFEELVKWFLFNYMEITSRPVPPVALHKRKINLLSLYLLVAADGGYKTVTTENMWPAIAKDLGFNYEDGDYMRTTYAMYLDILEYYYNFNQFQRKMQDKEVVVEEGRLTESHQRVSTKAEDAQQETAQETAGMGQAALFTRIDDEDWSKGKRRKRFNFDYARWAVEEANQSVLDRSRKHNLV